MISKAILIKIVRKNGTIIGFTLTRETNPVPKNGELN
jgi:hypothetical protein